MKSHWRKRIGNLLLAVGAALIVYLAVSQWGMDQREQKLIEQLEGMSDTAADTAQGEVPAGREKDGLAASNGQTDASELPVKPLASPRTVEATATPQSSPSATVTTPRTPEQPTAVALLQIPKINLRVPVADGSSQDILNYAVGHLEGTGRLGVNGENFVVVGHRSSVFGQFFNRLDEITQSDEFSLTAQNKTYTYRVVNKRIILPTQVEVTRPEAGSSRVTLITCHPAYSDRQRLVVTAELVVGGE